jgi:hypothetical protein
MKLASKIDLVLEVLDELTHVALNPLRYEELAKHEVKLGRILSRTRLVMSFLDTHKPVKRGYR